MWDVEYPEPPAPQTNWTGCLLLIGGAVAAFFIGVMLSGQTRTSPPVIQTYPEDAPDRETSDDRTAYVECPITSAFDERFDRPRWDTLRLLPLPNGLPHDLVYYGTHPGFGLLAPKGMHCSAHSGSGQKRLRIEDDTGTTVAELAMVHTETSGRYTAAVIYDRLFADDDDTDRSQLVMNAVHDEVHTRTRPYPHDQITRPAHDEARFRTPAGREGAGTIIELRPSDRETFGYVIDHAQPEGGPVYFFAMALPESNSEIEAAIVAQFTATFR